MLAFSFTRSHAMKHCISTLAFLTLLSLADAARAVDLDADDYSAGAIPAGTNLALLYLQHVERGQINADGKKVSEGNLTSDIGILRYARFVDIAGFRADPQFLLPFGQLRGSRNLSGLGETTGVGDLILAATVWLYNNPEQGEYFGFTPFVSVPTGSYDKNRSLNLGDNRWEFTAQVGYVTPVVSKDLSLQLAGDVTFYTANNDFGPTSRRLTQEPLVQLQAWLRYNITPDFDLRVGASHFTGGRTSVDGIANRDRVRTTNFKFGAGWNFAPGWNLVAVYGRDADVENGPKETPRLNLRLLHAF